MTDAAGGARGSARRQDVPHCASQSGHSGQLGPGTNPAWVRIPTLPAGSAFATWSARQARQGGTRAVCAGPQGPAVRMRACGALRLLGHRADSRPAPRTLPPPRQHGGWKQGWGAGLSPQPPGPAAPSRGLLSLAACVQGFGASLELPRGWVGGLRVPQAALGWQTRLGSRWGHPGLTPGRRVPLGHRTSVTVWTAVLWLLGRRDLLQQKRDTEVAGGQSGTSGGCPA